MARFAVPRSDRGASVVEFAMLAVLLVLLLFTVLQVALWFYARNVVASAAADAARYAASTAGTSDAGAQRARELIGTGLTAAAASDIPCVQGDAVDSSGLPTRTVHCRGRLRMALLPFDLPLTIDVRSSALIEATP